MLHLGPKLDCLSFTYSTSKSVLKKVFSYLLRETVLEAHQQLLEDMTSLKVQAHMTLGMSPPSSISGEINVFTLVLNAASWKTPSAFSNHYLQDTEKCEGDTFSLELIVAAGSIVA